MGTGGGERNGDNGVGQIGQGSVCNVVSGTVDVIYISTKV